MSLFILEMARGSEGILIHTVHGRRITNTCTDLNRYEDAAHKLGVSIEEVFDAAQELQQSFDRAHEEGKMNKQHHSWTYDVWVETE